MWRLLRSPGRLPRNDGRLLQLHPPLQLQIAIDHRHRKLIRRHILCQRGVLTEDVLLRAIISPMTRKKKFRIPRKKIAEFCKRWNINEFALFGSVLRADFRPDSDVDVLVSIDPKAHVSLFEIIDMKLELQDMFKRPVDLVEKEGLRNPYRRKEILNTAQVVYAAG
jgi:predicted nucleotidyltransferase